MTRNPAVSTPARPTDSFIWKLWIAGTFSILIACNIHIVYGSFPMSLIYLHDAVFLSGEWWRLITHPFVHVSWYHLLLDGGAFFLLLSEMKSYRSVDRFMIIFLCAAFSLLVADRSSPEILSHGLCGLSGTAHGMTAFLGLEMIRCSRRLTKTPPNQSLSRLGWITFLAVTMKSIYEAVSGHMIIEFMHFGLMGLPISTTHAGGVLGGISSFLLLSAKNSPQKQDDN